MDEDGALVLARGLAKLGVGCRVRSAGRSEYRLLVGLADGREALWDVHGDVLEARVLRDGGLLGFVVLRVGGQATADAAADLVAGQRYERLVTTGVSGALGDPDGRGRRGTGDGPAGGRGWRYWPGQTAVLVVVMTAVLLLLYLLDGRM